jgi:hypothetical protein
VIVYGGLAPWQKRKLKQYLSEHLEDQLCVDDLAKQVSLSIGRFPRAFKESFGTTPHRYLIPTRLKNHPFARSDRGDTWSVGNKPIPCIAAGSNDLFV